MLRQPDSVDVVDQPVDEFDEGSVSETISGWSRKTPLKWRLAAVSSVTVLFVVILLSVTTYWTVSKTMYEAADRELDINTSVMLENTMDPMFTQNIEAEVAQFKRYNPGYQVSVSPPGTKFTFGDTIPVGGKFQETRNGEFVSVRTVGDTRVMAKRNKFDAVVVMTYELTGTQTFLVSLGWVLMLVALVGLVVSIIAGFVAARTGLEPVARLKRALDYTAKTDELRPITQEGNDELASLATSFNQMISALQDSRNRQAQFVADAGHELKTPLTSMQTNIELMMMLNRPGVTNSISAEDRAELEQDIKEQMRELAALISDLVDLAREDAPEKPMEELDLQEVLEISLERAKRRRTDVTMDVHLFPWIMNGDSFALGRAMLNLMDNAAKWSPAGGTVRVYMAQERDDVMTLHIEDSGPGIPKAEREKVFERFYRAPESRSMPGSGLGLAIVKQVVERHHGVIRVEESRDGGCHMIVELPGKLGEHKLDVHEPRDDDLARLHRSVAAQQAAEKRRRQAEAAAGNADGADAAKLPGEWPDNVQSADGEMSRSQAFVERWLGNA